MTPPSSKDRGEQTWNYLMEAKPTPKPQPSKVGEPEQPSPGRPEFISEENSGLSAETTQGGPSEVESGESDLGPTQSQPGSPGTGLPTTHFVGGLVVFDNSSSAGLLPAPPSAPKGVMTNVDAYVGDQLQTARTINEMRAAGFSVTVVPVGASSTSAVSTLPLIDNDPTKQRLDPESKQPYAVYRVIIEPPADPDDPATAGDTGSAPSGSTVPGGIAPDAQTGDMGAASGFGGGFYGPQNAPGDIFY